MQEERIIGDRSFEDVTEFKYLEITLTNQNIFLEILRGN
jgi:hypothetical protein